MVCHSGRVTFVRDDKELCTLWNILTSALFGHFIILRLKECEFYLQISTFVLLFSLEPVFSKLHYVINESNFIASPREGDFLTLLKWRLDLTFFLIKIWFANAFQNEVLPSETNHPPHLQPSLWDTFSLKQKQIILNFSFAAGAHCLISRLHHKLEKLWFNSEMGPLRPLPWQPAAPFAKACALNRTSYTSSFPIKTQKEKNRSTPRRRNHKSRKATKAARSCANSRLARRACWKPILFERGAFPIRPGSFNDFESQSSVSVRSFQQGEMRRS